MPKRTPQGKVIAERNARILEDVKLGTTLPEIAAREGLELDYVARKRVELAGKAGLKIERRPRLHKDIAGKKLPYGLTSASDLLRSRLADKFAPLHNNGPYHPVELAGKIGITQANQKKAKQNPYNHDWTISQIERLAHLTGKDFMTLMRELTRG